MCNYASAVDSQRVIQQLNTTIYKQKRILSDFSLVYSRNRSWTFGGPST